jgi:carbon-monoxide dehydrogenase medium subunit
MKPPPFRYVRATSLEQATSTLAASGGEAKILAGGQSLVPMLNFRLLRPAVLVDINRLAQLDFIAEHGNGLRIGALTRHQTLERSALVADRFPVLAAAMPHVAHLAIRNRGTIGGSLAHADPAAELPVLALLLDATIEIVGPARHRVVAAADFFVGPLTTVLAEDEIVTAVGLPGLPPATGWGFEEFALRRGDFALAAVAATLTVADGRCIAARIAVIGGAMPVRAHAAEQLLEGKIVAPQVVADAAQTLRETVPTASSIHASAEFRTHLIGVLAERAIEAAWRRTPSTSQHHPASRGEIG